MISPRGRTFVLTVVLLSTRVVDAQDIRWAGGVDIARTNILHAPDARIAAVDPPIMVSDFGPVMRYTSLGALMRGSKCDLSKADVIAFEFNGGFGVGVERGWESSVWTFSDGAVSRTVTYDAAIGRASDPAVLCSGSILGSSGTEAGGGAVYAEFFRICQTTRSRRPGR